MRLGSAFAQSLTVWDIVLAWKIGLLCLSSLIYHLPTLYLPGIQLLSMAHPAPEFGTFVRRVSSRECRDDGDLRIRAPVWSGHGAERGYELSPKFGHPRSSFLES